MHRGVLVLPLEVFPSLIKMRIYLFVQPSRTCTIFLTEYRVGVSAFVEDCFLRFGKPYATVRRAERLLSQFRPTLRFIYLNRT
jgi:hypothetical protein